MTENAALRKIAGEYLLQDCYALAMEYFARVLRKEPTDEESRKQWAVAAARLAMESADPEELRKAEDALREALSHDWNWDIGHQYRIQVAEKAERLDELIREYRAVAGGEAPDRTEVANRAIQVIQLTLRFQTELPQVDSILQDPPTWSKYFAAFWPIMAGLPFLWMTIQKLIQDINDKVPIGMSLTIMLSVILGTGFLLFLTMRRLKQKKSFKKRKASFHDL